MCKRILQEYKKNGVILIQNFLSGFLDQLETREAQRGVRTYSYKLFLNEFLEERESF